ncbi:hypothetical protein EYF80_011443 [Liparis tanakae]|uniref:Uncharacterized protein n=1 Tax=Liparis tanakae TaxID=230148 RepID=A0A4Z2IM21_9TELE|nr:hypothetical protein EYF80_011443 [Liparis tanakae]
MDSRDLTFTGSCPARRSRLCRELPFLKILRYQLRRVQLAAQAERESKVLLFKKNREGEEKKRGVSGGPRGGEGGGRRRG